MADKAPPWIRGTSSQLSASGLLPSQPQVQQVKVPIKVKGFPPALILGNDGFIFKNIYKDTGATCTLVGPGSGNNESEPLHILIEHSNTQALQHAKRVAENLVNMVEKAYLELLNKKIADQQRNQVERQSEKNPHIDKVPATSEKEGTHESGFKMFKPVSQGFSFGNHQEKEAPSKFVKPDHQPAILLVANWNLALAGTASNKLLESGPPTHMIDKSLKSYDIVCLQNTRMNWGEHQFGNYKWYTSGSFGSTKHGVAILVSTLIKDLNLIAMNRISEYICTATFTFKGKRFKIICCYLPPSSEPWSSSVKATVAAELAETNVFTILLGDFNAEIGSSDLTKDDLLRMGTSHSSEKSNENGLYLTSLSRSKNLKLASLVEASRSMQKYHILVNSIDTYECKSLSINKAKSPVFDYQILRFALRPKLGINEHKSEATSVNSPKTSDDMRSNVSINENQWMKLGSNVEDPQISSESMSSANENDSKPNPFKRTFQDADRNPFGKSSESGKLQYSQPKPFISTFHQETNVNPFAKSLSGEIEKSKHSQPNPFMSLFHQKTNVNPFQKSLSSETEKSNYSQSNLFTSTVHQGTNENPFAKFQPKIARMDPFLQSSESSVQKAQTNQLFAETTTNPNVIQAQSTWQAQEKSDVPTKQSFDQEKFNQEKSINSCINPKQPIAIESQNKSDKKSQHDMENYAVSARIPEDKMTKSIVWCNDVKCKLQAVPKTVNSFYSTIGYQLFPCVDPELGLSDLAKVLHQRTINYIRSMKCSFFTDVCNLYNNLFPNHGYDEDLTFEHGCLHLLSKPGSCGEEIAARAIASLFTTPIVILEEVAFKTDSTRQIDRIILGPYSEMLPDSGNPPFSSSSYIMIIKRKSPENHYNIISTVNKSVHEFLSTLKEAS